MYPNDPRLKEKPRVPSNKKKPKMGPASKMAKTENSHHNNQTDLMWTSSNGPGPPPPHPNIPPNMGIPPGMQTHMVMSPGMYPNMGMPPRMHPNMGSPMAGGMYPGMQHAPNVGVMLGSSPNEMTPPITMPVNDKPVCIYLPQQTILTTILTTLHSQI